jgi:hypothetical protein
MKPNREKMEAEELVKERLPLTKWELTPKEKEDFDRSTTEAQAVGIARAAKRDLTPAGERFCEILRKIFHAFYRVRPTESSDSLSPLQRLGVVARTSSLRCSAGSSIGSARSAFSTAANASRGWCCADSISPARLQMALFFGSLAKPKARRKLARLKDFILVSKGSEELA